MEHVKIGIIGGSGLYKMEGFTDVEEVKVSTPFGDPSDAIVIGTLEGKRVAFLPRHGRGHRIMPSEINYRANIWALKSLGVERIIAVSACGSMKEEIAPRDIVIPDQLFDHTKGKRAYSFFGDGIVVHVSFAEPFCPELSELVYQAVKKTGARVHRGGTFIVIEGPRFSSKGESRIYRQWGVDIIGMTASPEAQLAREAEICYSVMAHVTDYDVWHETEEPVTAEMVIRNLEANVKIAQEALRYLISAIPEERTCACSRALADAIVTQRDLIPQELKEKLRLLIGKYIQ
ncbi:MAG: S-methyl-5'-thioadenosine phosphorylase [Anaerolineae bacterium]|nr:S-methyl-5'-thioadenosine phosphorylase [Anaerolineae bacterium]MDW8101820.1 S-methyl-5'-thioadenosine phosphorylase [Anaerolineae bacterium]